MLAIALSSYATCSHSPSRPGRLGEESRTQLLSELTKLNLSKYVEEVALGVAEAKLKV